VTKVTNVTARPLSEIRSPAKVIQFFPLVGPISVTIIPNVNEIGQVVWQKSCLQTQTQTNKVGVV